MSQLHQAQVVIQNQLINFYERRSENAGAVTLLFLHGWRSDASIWNTIISLLPDTYSVYALDLPGFGKSELPKKDFTVQDYAQIVLGFTRKLDFQNLIIIGHSFGGRVALKLAANAADINLRKLVLVGTPTIRTRSIVRSLKQLIAKILKPLFSFRFMAGLRRKIYEHMGAGDYVATPGLRNTFVNVINEDLSSLLSKVSVPTLLLWGEQDIEAPVSVARQAQVLIPTSQLLTLPQAGHFIFLDNPQWFVKQLTDFIDA